MPFSRNVSMMTLTRLWRADTQPLLELAMATQMRLEKMARAEKQHSAAGKAATMLRPNTPASSVMQLCTAQQTNIDGASRADGQREERAHPTYCNRWRSHVSCVTFCRRARSHSSSAAAVHAVLSFSDFCPRSFRCSSFSCVLA